PVIAATEFQLQYRARQLVKNLARQFLQARQLGLAEIEFQRQLLGFLWMLFHGLVEGGIKRLEVQAVKRLAAQVVDRAHRRQHTMATRFRQQRAVVARAQVTVIATEIDDLDAAGGKTGGALQILLRRHQVLGGVIGGPVLDIFNNQNDVRHDAPLAGGMGPLRSFWAKA